VAVAIAAGIAAELASLHANESTLAMNVPLLWMLSISPRSRRTFMARCTVPHPFGSSAHASVSGWFVQPAPAVCARTQSCRTEVRGGRGYASLPAHARWSATPLCAKGFDSRARDHFAVVNMILRKDCREPHRR
jgi:hypothetical protein